MHRAIKTNQDLLPETPWINIFYDDFWGTLLPHSGSHKSYRPLCTLSFRLNYALGGLDPWGFHLVNAVLHCATTALFSSLSSLLLGSGCWSLLAGLLFAAHPIHTEAVAGIVGRADVGAALFFLLALRCYLCHCSLRTSGAHGWSWMWFLGTLACASCSMLWKEQGVTVLAVAAVYDVFVFHRLKLQQVPALFLKKKNLHLLMSVFLLGLWGIILLACRLYWMGNKPPNFSNSDNPAADCPCFLTRTLTFFFLPAMNVWLLLCPDMLSFDWSMDALPLLRSITDWRNLHTVAFYTSLLALAWFGLCLYSTRSKETNGKAHHVANGKSTNGHSCSSDYEHSTFYSNSVQMNGTNGTAKHYPSSLPTTESLVVFSLGLLAIPFIPATNLFFYVGFVVAERVLYIPSMGFCLLVAVGMRALYVRLRRKSFRTLVLGCSAALVLLFGIKTVLRNRDWQNEEMLYKSGISVNPAKAWGNLGNVLKNQGKVVEAEQAYRNALYYRRNMADMLYNLGLLLQENNRFSEALHYYKLAIGSRPTLASAYLNTGIVLMNQGRLEEAKRTFVTCADIPDENLKDPHAHKSSVTSCLYNLGKLLHEQGHQEGQKTEAEKFFLKAIELDPTKGNCYMHYGQFLLEESRLLEAAEMAGKAAHLDSEEFDVVFSAAHMLRDVCLLSSCFNKDPKILSTSGTTDAVTACQDDVVRDTVWLECRVKRKQGALMNLGAILHLNGKHQEAEANYLRALQLKPDDTITQSNLRKLWNIMEKQGLRTMAP
ncbi:hypothetical protein cypCar_00024573 [Cyprinus carpio]|nr:hypothetical protein cypCar_00024573 [Cyprinus carpio]